MWGGNSSYTPVFILFAIVCAVVGWAFIEGLRWAFSYVHLSFGK